MKGTISGIKRMEIHDGDGLRTTVFFKGCPLKCVWCHNPESISFDKQVAKFDHKCISCGSCGGEKSLDASKLCPTEALKAYGDEYSAEELADILIKDKRFFENSGGGVTLSGGECLAQPHLAIELARILYKNGVSVYVDTCGYVKREVLEAIMPYTDVFLYDLKAIDAAVHKKCTGHDNALILDNIRFLSESGCTIEIRYPLVVGYNDSECDAIGNFVKGLNSIKCVKVLRYHDLAASRYEALGMANTLPPALTTDADVNAAVKRLQSMGINAKK